MSATVVDCTSEEFAGLTNPYTGEPLRVKMVIAQGGVVFFHDPDTYSTTQPFGSVAEAHRQWSRVDGVFGCRPDGEPAKCAYTGELLTPRDDGSYSGGFDPTVFHTREEFLYFATMRDGKSKYPAPGTTPRTRVISVAEKPPMSATHEPGYVDGALEAAGDALAASGVDLPRRCTVVSGATLGKRRKGK